MTTTEERVTRRAPNPTSSMRAAAARIVSLDASFDHPTPGSLASVNLAPNLRGYDYDHPDLLVDMNRWHEAMTGPH
jgi:hypothetical protein